MVKAVIVDDEVNSRETLRGMLRIYCPEILVVAEAEGVKSALQCVEQLKPDLVFLDIKMPDGSGFDFLQKASPIDFRVIFVTAYEEYAIKAFKFNAVDYITKPVDADELQDAVKKAMELYNSHNVNNSIRMLLENMGKPAAQQNKKIVLRTSNTVYVIEIEHIIRCESDRNYTVFHLIGKEKILISRSMKDFEDILEGHGFHRVHNSHLINFNYVKKFMKDDLILVLTDNTNIPVAYRKRDELLQIIQTL